MSERSERVGPWGHNPDELFRGLLLHERSLIHNGINLK